MATVDFYIWKRPSKDGKFPISVRITINRKPSYIMTGQKLESLDQWDAKKQRVKEKTHPNATRLNNFLRTELAKANDKALEMETKGQVSAKAVKAAVRPVEEKPIYFVDIANQYLEEQFALGNYDVHKTDRARLIRFYQFTKDGKVPFIDITVEFLRAYIIFLRREKRFKGSENGKVKPLSERTIMNHLLIIRTIYNRAITAKVTTKNNYPFGSDGIVIKFGKSSKIGLDVNEIIALEQIDLSKLLPIYNDARNAWLIEYYFAGMRVTDCLLLKWTDFQNERLYYQMSKNGEHGSLKTPAKALLILQQYRGGGNDLTDNKHGLVFPFLKHLENLNDRLELRRQISFVVTRLDRTMGKIMKMINSTKNASQHKARHSFAQRAEEKEIHPKVLQKMYRHESIETTMKYQSNFSFEKMDNAIDAVVGF
ncbi:MAG: site-specific integrase [Mucilaginibacter sp.]|uniref:site-specific integrase n=1 Tax=Mucilaginibacter sp. TaxID=1882438 RepID=UPI003264AD96